MQNTYTPNKTHSKIETGNNGNVALTEKYVGLWFYNIKHIFLPVVNRTYQMQKLHIWQVQEYSRQQPSHEISDNPFN